jgi:2-desacetyl-2-hydroxyethyl bacteriochlorophyllide A dehydrogenase
MRALQAVIVEPYRVEVREAGLPPPAPNQILVQTEASAVSAGTELAVWTGTHQWLKDPNLPDWKFPFRPGYSAAGRVAAVGSAVGGWRPGDRVSYPGNHASHELLTLGHERGRLWRLPDGLDAERAALACVARYGMGAGIRAGLTLGRSAAVLGLGVIGQFALRCLLAAGAHPVAGIDGVRMRRDAARAAGADHVIDPAAGDVREQLSRYIEVTGAHGNMLFEPAHVRLAGAWDINKAQAWLLAQMAANRLNLTGLVSHRITANELGASYEGLLKKKEEYLGVVLRW